MSYELAQKFAEYEMPAEIRQMYRSGRQLVGSFKFTKMMLFANDVDLTNDNIDYYMSLENIIKWLFFLIWQGGFSEVRLVLILLI